MVAKGLTEPVTHESTFSFHFPDCERLPPPVLPFVNVSFSYSGKAEDYLYQARNFLKTKGSGHELYFDCYEYRMHVF